MRTLCVDIDGTVADTVSNWLRIANFEYGIGKSKTDISEYDMSRATGMPADAILSIFRRVWDDYPSIMPVDKYASAVLGKLHRVYKIEIVTATVGQDEAVKAWLKLNNVLYDEFIHVNSEASKVNVAGDVYIDDNPITAKALAEKEKYVIMIKQNWNKCYDVPDGVKVARNWLDVEKLLLRR
ncbi:MAG: hypothetical protein QXW10_01660 [Candidatus Micrarchaeaceae archaeon]